MALRFIDITELHLQFVAGSSAKQYEVILDADTATVTTRWGRIGNVNQSQVFACESVDAARTLAVRKVTEKVNKGYGYYAERRVGGQLVIL